MKNIKRVYSIRDDKMQSYDRLCFIENDAVAARMYGDMVTKEKDSLVALHAGDFALWFVGLFDADAGIFIQNTDAANPHIVCRASDFVKPNTDEVK